MFQLVYVSSARPGVTAAEIGPILEVSRENNRREGISGLLYSDGVRFLQALEGPEEAVVARFERIRADLRHRALVVLSRRTISEREFGDWAMAHHGPGESAEQAIEQVRALVADAAPSVRATFEGFAEMRRAA